MQDFSCISLVSFLVLWKGEQLTFVQCSSSGQNGRVGRLLAGHLRIASPLGTARDGKYSDLKSTLRAGKVPTGEWQHKSISYSQKQNLDQRQHRRLTSPGIYSPRTLAPPFGQTRGIPLATGGYIRNASSRQASI